MPSGTLRYSEASYVLSSGAGKNYSKNNYLYVGYGSSSYYYSCLKFDLSQLPSGCTINSAELQLYSYSNSTWSTASNISVHKITSAWSDSTLKFNAIPSYVSTAVSSKSQSGYNTWYTWDVTSAVQEQYAGTNYGLFLKQANTTKSRTKCFKKDDAAYYPRLILDITVDDGRGKVLLVAEGIEHVAKMYIFKNGSWTPVKAKIFDGSAWNNS